MPFKHFLTFTCLLQKAFIMDHKVTSQVPVIPLAQVLLWCGRIDTFSKLVAVGQNERIHDNYVYMILKLILHHKITNYLWQSRLLNCTNSNTSNKPLVNEVLITQVSACYSLFLYSFRKTLYKSEKIFQIEPHGQTQMLAWFPVNFPIYPKGLAWLGLK